MCRWKTTFKQQHKNGSDDSTKTPVDHSTIWLTIRLSSLTQLCFFIFFLSKCVAEWWRDNFPTTITTTKKHFGSIINERKAENELIFGLGYGRQSSLNAIGIERMSLPYYQELTTTTTKNNLETIYTTESIQGTTVRCVCVCVYRGLAWAKMELYKSYKIDGPTTAFYQLGRFWRKVKNVGWWTRALVSFVFLFYITGGGGGGICLSRHNPKKIDPLFSIS